MLRVLYSDLRHNLITARKPTSQNLHLNVLYNVLGQNDGNPFLKSFSSNAPESKHPPPSISITVDYLVNSCGLSPHKALSAAKKFNSFSIEKADSVISLFQSYGLSKTHITKLITLCPQLLFYYDPNKVLKPKFDFLCELGVSEPDFVKLIAGHPTLLTRSLNSQIIPCYDFLKNYIDSGVGIIMVLKQWPGILSYNLEKVLKPNISILQAHNVPDCNISRMLILYPIAIGCNSNHFKESVEKIKNMGFDSLSLMFCRAVGAMTSINESIWDKKLIVYREFGLLENNVISAFKKQPNCMSISEENIRRSLEFFVEKLKCKPIDILSRPAIMLYSLEKRIIPRCAVLKILYMKGIIRGNLNLFTIFKMAEKDSSEKFVIMYGESVPEVIKAYKGGIEFIGFEKVVEVKGLSIKPGLLAV